MHFDTISPLPEETAVMTYTVDREESEINMAREWKNTHHSQKVEYRELLLHWESHKGTVDLKSALEKDNALIHSPCKLHGP